MWLNNIDEIRRCLGSLIVTDCNVNNIDTDKAFDIFTDLAIQARDERKTIFLVGNGASASMSSHIAADLAKNADIHTEVFTDLSLITAIANDISFDEVFAEPLKKRLAQGDILVEISSSGKSQNTLRAAEITKQYGGKVITLSAMDADNPLRKTGDLNFYVPAATYGMAETCHAAILHHWIDRVTLFKKNK
jgi:D-sedoheptulose 7-phosphate isomerase